MMLLIQFCLSHQGLLLHELAAAHLSRWSLLLSRRAMHRGILQWLCGIALTWKPKIKNVSIFLPKHLDAVPLPGVQRQPRRFQLFSRQREWQPRGEGAGLLLKENEQ